MVLLGDKAQVKTRFSPFGDSANLDGTYVHGLRQTYDWLRIFFEMHPMVLRGDEA
jgi:hypothetical protein